MENKHEIVVELVDASMSADYTRVRRAGAEIARILDQGGQKGAARKIRSLMRRKGLPLQV